MYIYTHNEILFSIERNKTLPNAATQIDLREHYA